MNLNDMARRITLEEGKKKNLTIGDVKEVMRLTFIDLGTFEDKEVIKTLNRYRKK
jgi:hypothetical protein